MKSRSYKKLKSNLKLLQKIDGLGYILDPTILKEQIDLGLSKEAIRKKFSLSGRDAHTTWKYAKKIWPEETRKVSSSAYRNATIGNSRAEHLPIIRVSREKLLSCFQKFTTLEEIKKELNLTDFLLHRNIVENKLQYEYIKFKDNAFKSIVVSENTTEKISTFFPKIKDLLNNRIEISENISEDIHKLYIELFSLSQSIKAIGRKVSSRCKNKNKLYKAKFFSNNIGEVYLCELLYNFDIIFYQNFKLQNYFYDFYLPDYNIIIEVDGTSHDILEVIDKDKDKSKVALDNGYELVRVKWTGTVLKYEQLHKAIQNKKHKEDRNTENI